VVKSIVKEQKYADTILHESMRGRDGKEEEKKEA
jgi:hypothetical protein